MIELIAKSKLLEFIDKRPEAQIPLLMWLKENQLNRFYDSRSTEGTSQLGASKFHVRVQINPSLQVAFIKWLGTSEEIHQLVRAEIEKLKSSGIEEKVVTETIYITPPPIDSTAHSAISKDFFLDLPSLLEPAPPQPAVETYGDLVGYQQALDKALSIFHSDEGSPDYDELARLLPAIKSYEALHISLPPLDLARAIKQRLDEFEIPVEHVPYSIASRTEIELFLSGEHTLSKKQLQSFLKFLGFHFKL